MILQKLFSTHLSGARALAIPFLPELRDGHGHAHFGKILPLLLVLVGDDAVVIVHPDAALVGKLDAKAAGNVEKSPRDAGYRLLQNMLVPRDVAHQRGVIGRHLRRRPHVPLPVEVEVRQAQPT